MIDALTILGLFLGNARPDAADRSARQPAGFAAERGAANAASVGPGDAAGLNLSATPVPPLDISSQTTAQQEQEPQNGKQRPPDPATEVDEANEEQALPLSGKKEGEGPDGLTDAERKKVQQLKQRDREVRAHEAAHKAAGGSLASAPTFETVIGPDGRSYAVSGEVKIDTSPVPNNPEATIRKMEIVRRAALAPSQPSAQDQQVAAEAAAKIQQARAEKREQEAEEREKIDATDEFKPGGFDRSPLSPSGKSGGPTSEDRDGPDRGIPTPIAINPGALLDLVA